MKKRKAAETLVLVSPGRIVQCKNCLEYFTEHGFARDEARPARSVCRQAWCRRCKAEWETRPEKTWGRFEALLRNKEPENLLPGPNRWTRALYCEIIASARGLCTLCGARLREWQSTGHNLDRIDPDGSHFYANCRVVCWPCNRIKLDMEPHAADAFIADQVAHWGRGKVPWQKVRRGFARVEPVDMMPYRVDNSAPMIPGLEPWRK